MRRIFLAVSTSALLVIAAMPMAPTHAASTATDDPPPMALPADPWMGGATYQSITSAGDAVMLVGSTSTFGVDATTNSGLWTRGLRSGTADPAFGTNGTVMWPPHGSLSSVFLEPSGVAYALFTPDGADRPRAIASVATDGTPGSLVELPLPEPAAPDPRSQGLVSASGAVLVRKSDVSAVTVERYLLGGTPDTTFGGTSVVTVPTPSTAIHELLVSPTPDGGVLVVAAGLQGKTHTLFRLDAEGTLVAGPAAFTMAGAGTAVRSVAAVGDRTLVASWTAVAAFHPDGAHDTAYGVDGIASVPWGSGFWFAPDGSAVAIEYVLPEPDMVVRVARLGTTGDVVFARDLAHPFQVKFAARADDGSYWLAPATGYRSSDPDVPEARQVSLLAPDGRVNVGFPPRSDLPSVGLDLLPLAVWAVVLVAVGAGLAAPTTRRARLGSTSRRRTGEPAIG